VGCYRTILVAVDGSADAAAALRHAVTLARDQHARLVLLSVVPPPPPQVAGPVAVTPVQMPSDDVFARILREAADSLPPDIGVETRLARGRPAKRILETAAAVGCDLVVMGFHGHGRLHHALMGSVSDAVLRDSRRPVLLMRAADERGGARPEPTTA
jgi:nucleotide-binding universal stress UspA family protein